MAKRVDPPTLPAVIGTLYPSPYDEPCRSRQQIRLGDALAQSDRDPPDALPARDLFIAANRLLSPPEMRDAFEAFIDRAPAYVDPAARRLGIARQMLDFAENECRRRGISELKLSTSELQVAALALYKNTGYEFVREEVAHSGINKTVGSGIRRFYFTKITVTQTGGHRLCQFRMRRPSSPRSQNRHSRNQERQNGCERS